MALRLEEYKTHDVEEHTGFGILLYMIGIHSAICRYCLYLQISAQYDDNYNVFFSSFVLLASFVCVRLCGTKIFCKHSLRSYEQKI